MSATTILYGKNLSNFFGNGCVSVVGSLVFLWGGGENGRKGFSEFFAICRPQFARSCMGSAKGRKLSTVFKVKSKW